MVPKLIYTWGLIVQIIKRRGTAHKRLTSILIMPWYEVKSPKEVPQIINTSKAYATITHGLKGGLGLICYPLKHNIAYFLFFYTRNAHMHNNHST